MQSFAVFIQNVQVQSTLPCRPTQSKPSTSIRVTYLSHVAAPTVADYDYQPSASLPADGRRGDPGAPGKDTGRRRIHGGSRSNSNKRQRGFSSSEKGAQIRAVIQAIKDVSAAGLSEDVPAMVEDARRAGVPIDARYKVE